MLEQILKDVGMQFPEMNTAVIEKDDVTVRISVSTVTNCTAICVSVPLKCREEEQQEIERRIALINGSSLIPLGYYWFDHMHGQLQLRTSMLIDTEPEAETVEDVLNQLIAPVIAAAGMLGSE